MTSTALITREYNGNGTAFTFTFREDGWFNMTKAAQHFGKDLSHFMRSPRTMEYLEALNSAKNGVLIESKAGRYGGTWAHPKLAVFFASWLDVGFSVWCDAVIEDILKGAAEVTITKPQESPVMALPKTMSETVEAWLVTLKEAERLQAEKAQLEAH